MALFIFTSLPLVLRFFEFEGKTGAYDLGIQAGTARNIVFKHSFFDPVMNMNLLGDHFEPALALPGLLFYLWDSAAVTILFQNVCVFLSIYLGYVLAKKILHGELRALFITILFVFNSHLRDANLFPFHIEILAMPLFFLLLVFIEQEKSTVNKLYILIISLLMCTIKEDVPLTLAVFGLWVLLFKKEKRPEGAMMLFVGMSAFLIISAVLMPYFSGGGYTHLGRYDNLGASRGEIIRTILFRPDKVLLNLVSPPEKVLFFSRLFKQFAFLPFLAPTYIFAGFSPLFYNMVSNCELQYQFGFQYSITLLPFLFYSSLYGLKNLRRVSARFGSHAAMKMMNRVFALFCILLVITLGYRYFGKYTDPFRDKNIQKLSYNSILEKTIKPKIPLSSKIYAVSHIQPHFIEYNYAGMFSPDLDFRQQPDNTFVILTKDEPWFPSLEQAGKYNQAIIDLKKNLSPVYEDGYFIVVKKP